jgi:AcrR family transcriptional regulator
VPKIVDAEEQRREIRQAAFRVFSRRGVTRTGLAHVANAAGMGRSSLYHYYPDKNALVRDLTRELLAAEESLFVEAARADGSPLRRIERLGERLAAMFDDWSALGRMIFDLRTLQAARFRRFFRRARTHLASVVQEGQRAGEIDRTLDAELAAATVIGAVDGLLLQDFVDPSAFPDRAALSESLVHTLRKVLRP